MTDLSQPLVTYSGTKDILAWFTLPILITVPLIVFYYCIAHFGTGQGIGMGAFFTISLWFVFEWLFPHRHDWKKSTDKQLFNNIFHMALSIFGRISLQQWFKVVVYVAISDYLVENDMHFVLTVWPDHWPVIAQIALCIFIAEGLNYGRHRLLHESSVLWPMHTLHHSVDRLHSLKGGNTHIIEVATGVFVVAPPLILLGCPGDIFVWYGVVNMVLPAHANIRMKLPSFVHYLIVTPAVHYLHHSKNTKYGNANYASALPIWDILFGTFYHPDKHDHGTLGIEGDRTPRHLPGQLVAPLIWYRLKKREA